eukprot:TRINITY_DN12903_c0_g1_i1.p1 TRINITY_DN12903_c0_g1~~TRINITY_DN12903_c0_g1_i1.p1  ORF type:complete len:127 (+),score=25.97 TRINITY_DN12903_c0_g1_i1:77-457(+)
MIIASISRESHKVPKKQKRTEKLGNETNWSEDWSRTKKNSTTTPHAFKTNQRRDPEGYYEILGLDPVFEHSIEDIKKAFHSKALKLHPDMHPQEKKQWATQQFNKLTQAYQVLRNKEKKAKYDMQG